MKQETIQLTGGNFKGTRRALDFYPTPPECTVALLDFLEDNGLSTDQVVWEPAAGDGAISSVLRDRGFKVIETDITTGQDYLTTYMEADSIITNPPFNLAEEFIRKAVGEISSKGCVAMLLKSQFWHASKRYGLFNETMPRYVLPLTWRPDFLAHTRAPGDKKGSPTMEVAWTVWTRSNFMNPEYYLLERPKA